MKDETLTVKWENREWRVVTNAGHCLYRCTRKRDATNKARILAEHGGWSRLHIWRISGQSFESEVLKS